MEARLNPSLAPHFWELDPVKAFQPLCVDLLAKERGIGSADEYGMNGQAQRGIDILGKDINGQITVVGQCKCYENFTPAQVIKAAEEFHKHHSYWKEQGVTHFILMVACDLSDRKIQDEIINQRKRLIQIGIYFDAWSSMELRNKLMPYPEIAQRHIHSQEVLRNICGPTVQGLIFTPNASIETTLQELREAMREPDSYSADIEDLFIEEAKNIINVVQNPPRLDLSNFNSTSCNQYLQPFISVSEKLVKLSSELIKLDRQERFIEVLVRSLTILAQDPLKFSNGSASDTQGIPEIRLYPLALMIYTIYIIGTERKSTKILQEMTKIYFKSKRSSYLEKKNLPAILEYMFFSDNTRRFFKEINSNLIPIPTTIKGTLLPWLENYLIFDENAYWSGEFILSLTFLDPKDTQEHPSLFPSLYSYFPESIPSLKRLLKNKKWLKELFPDIEDRLQLFDKSSIKASQEPSRNYETYEPMCGFCGKTLNLYENS